MIKLCKRNDESVMDKVRLGQIDKIKLSTTNLVDDIILCMHNSGLLEAAFGDFPDKRHHNTVVPFNLVMALAVAAKMRVNTSLTDIPYAITDHRVINALGYNLISDKNEFMTEGTIRHLVGKYTANEFFNEYIEIAQKRIPPLLGIDSDIHILDCTKLEVNIDNENYEESGFINYEGQPMRGYKLSTIRSIVDDTGIIQDIRFGKISDHDLTLSYDMLLTTPVLKSGDILINDRGFISRELINTLKTDRGVDTYIPLRKGMEAYNTAVMWAKENDKWTIHPNGKRTRQKLSPVIELGTCWQSSNPELDVPIIGCVVHDELKMDYYVFVTTDTSMSSKNIIRMYELRPEIEEDYRQLKDFWKLEDFKSTKLNVIAFHIMCVLLGYLFFQMYTMFPSGEHLARKSLPAVLKNYIVEADHYYIIYSGDEFAIVNLIDLMKLYAESPDTVREKFSEVLV